MAKTKTPKEKPTPAETVAVAKKTQAEEFFDNAQLFISSVAEDIKLVNNKETPDEKRAPIVRDLRDKLKKFAASMQGYITVMSERIKEAEKAINTKYPNDRYNYMYFLDEFINEIQRILKTQNLLHTELARATAKTKQEEYERYRSSYPDVSEERLQEIIHPHTSDIGFGGHDDSDLNAFFKSTEKWGDFMRCYHLATILAKHEFRIKDDAEVQEYIHEEKKFPTFNDNAMKLLLSQMILSSANNSAHILKGVYKTDDFTFKWDLYFFTSPRQLKILFADRFKRYPQFTMSYEYNNTLQNFSNMGEFTIDLQFAYALVHGSTDVETPKLNPSKKEEE